MGKTKTVTLKGFIVKTYVSGSIVTGSATLTGTTDQPTMSDEQMEEMQCALLRLLTKSTSSPISKNRLKFVDEVNTIGTAIYPT
jgi:hypothetical protein